jgi:predicted ATPase
LRATSWYKGDFSEARQRLEQALAIDDSARHREPILHFNLDVTSTAMVFLPLVLWPLGLLDHAASFVEKAVSSALETSHIPSIALVYLYAADFEMIRRDRSRTAPLVQALLGLAREHKIPDCIAIGTFDEGWVLSAGLDREAGVAKMHEGMAMLHLRQEELFMPLRITLLAEVEAEAGRPDAGLAIVDDQLATIERTGQRWFLAELHRARGEILLKCPPCDHAAAESAFIRAIDVARSQEAKLFELQAAVSLARLWQHQGKRVEARDLLGPIYNRFTEGLDAPALKEAKTMMEQLTS